MMKESCLYSRWKKTLEIAAYYYMKGFIQGLDPEVKNFSLNKCIDEPQLPKEKKSNKRKNDDDDVDDDYYGRRQL